MNELLAILERHPDWEICLTRGDPSLRAINLRMVVPGSQPLSILRAFSPKALASAKLDLLAHEARRMERELELAISAAELQQFSAEVLDVE